MFYTNLPRNSWKKKAPAFVPVITWRTSRNEKYRELTEEKIYKDKKHMKEICGRSQPATGSSIRVTGVPQKIGINDVETMTDFLVQQ